MTPTFESEPQDLLHISGRHGYLPALPTVEPAVLEIFTVNIRNRNTRKAYFIAVSQFSNWCESRKLILEKVEPTHVAVYIEFLMRDHSYSL
jgi:hypothetical protein